MVKRETITVEPLLKPVRLSDYCVGKFSIIPSRKGIKKAIGRGEVQLNKKVAYSGDWLVGGEIIDLIISNEIPPKPKFHIPLKILLEDDHIAVINKPAGWISSGSALQTIEKLLPNNLQKSSEPDALVLPQCVHRLDRGTSGALVIGKTRSAVRMLNKQFENGQVMKEYKTVVHGLVAQNGLILLPLAGKPASTKFVRLQSWKEERGIQSLLEVTIQTGRNHQIRKHLKGVGHPVAGEELSKRWRRLMLHAVQISFNHPYDQKRLRVIAPSPKSFEKAIPQSEDEPN